MSGLPAFQLRLSGLSKDEAYEAWRKVMARMFHIDRTSVVDGLPRGEMQAVQLGELMANRSFFNAQSLSRERRRVDATPDHLVLQLYSSGGFNGHMGGRTVRISTGQVAICDLRRPLDVQAVTSHTVGLTVPRHLLDGVDLDHLQPRLDPMRERLLAARLTALHRRLPTLAPSELPGVTADLVAALRRLFDPSETADVLEARELDADLLGIAEQLIAQRLASPDLSPDLIAERLRVSRATLYRAFAPVGGVMRRTWTMRLEAVRAALELPAEPRTLTRLAANHGFKDAAHLSRSFRARFGVTPRDWRSRQASCTSDAWQAEAARLDACWHQLGL